jgi:thiamine kinase-like enzyme
MIDLLGKEILAALEQAGIRVRSFVRISKLNSAYTSRDAYRIDHDRGTVKARRLEDETTACKLAMFGSELPDAFAPILFRHGRVLIEDWIDGDALPDIPEPHHLATAGAILGELHARSAIAHHTLHEMRSTADHLLATQKCLRILLTTRLLGEEDAVRLERALQRLDPLQDTYGLIHLDFCGENMVIDRAGRLRVVDNDRMRLDLLGYDLGRTWCRWSLPAPEWDSFCLAYTSRQPFPNPLGSLHFWKIVAAARSAELRMRLYPERIDVPLRCLRALAAAEKVCS